MKKVKFTTTMEKTWLIFDPNKLISISVDNHQRTLNGRQVLRVSFSGEFACYDEANYRPSKAINPYFGTIIHYYGGADLQLSHNSVVYNTSGHFIRTAMVAQTSIQEAIAALITRRSHRMESAKESITIEVTEEGVGLCNFPFSDPFFFIKFQKELRHKEIELGHQVFENENLKYKLSCHKQNDFYKGELSTLLGNITENFLKHDYTTLYYEDECQEGFVLHNGTDPDEHIYHLIRYEENPYLFEGKGIKNTSVKSFIAIPHGFTIQKIFKIKGIILFSASWISPDRHFQYINLLSSSFMGEEEHFSFTLAEYRTNDDLDDYIENNLTIDHILENGNEYDPTLHELADGYTQDYDSGNFFEARHKDLFYVTPPLDYYFLGAMEQGDPKCAMILFLCYIIKMFFESGMFLGTYIEEEVYQEDNQSYLNLVIDNLKAKETNEHLKRVWTAYSGHLHEFNGGKSYKKAKLADLYGDPFPKFFARYIWQYSHSEEHILGLIDALLNSMSSSYS